MKIGFVLDDSLDKSDGVQQYVLSVGEWLKLQGHTVHYLVSTTQRQDVTNIHSLARNVEVRFNGNRMSMPLPARLKAIKQLLQHEQFDVLHIQTPYSPLFAQRVIMAAPQSTAILATFHIVPHSRHVALASRGLALWTAPSLHRLDAAVSVSSAAQAFAKDVFKLETTVVPNTVDVKRFQSAKPYTKYESTITIMFLGRLVPRKGCQVLLEAINLLSTQTDLPPYRVVICGRGPLAAKLQTYVQKHNLASLVEFTGFVSETAKPRYLQSADIAVFPSTGGESFGIVLLEAMAAGALTLAADNSGYHSVLHSKPELLFRVDDAQQLAGKLIDYLQNSHKRQTAILWQTKQVAQFDTDAVGHQIVEVYERALQARQNMQ